MSEQTYIFKVLFKRGIWRRIQLSASHTLQDLHEGILTAYDFGDEHLYAFFMEGKPWRGIAYWSPLNDKGPFADAVELRNLGLQIKQKFLYLYDFGDEWEFSVQLEKILETDIPILRPIILESRGEGPQQYPDPEEWE